MELSIIIVNYNVRFFLEQCLNSVFNASSGLTCEVFVVDNNSVDGSCQMVREKFPSVNLICNKVNLGFARANNIAIKKAGGDHILLLNPDTIVEENTFVSCLDFMKKHPEAGSLGVRMIDGKGNFLPESKRSLPTPAVAFYKIFGLSRLFPRSKRFGRYHLGFLDNDKIHEVEVLPGAFMWIRKSVLEKTGYLDESFFMYGEDIDLSYRIIQAGYKNYYYPETTIIHYKGESTKKSSVNYVIVFYNAMRIFARKHFSGKNARMYNSLINIAIYLRAAFSLSRRLLLGAITPLLDIFFIYAGFFIIRTFWERFKFQQSGSYPDEFLYIVVPAYIFVWIISLFLNGCYEGHVRVIQVPRGVFTGALIILIIYALLPESMRFSRAIILIGTLWVLVSTISIRYLLSLISKSSFKFEIKKTRKRIAIIGRRKEGERVFSILNQTHIIPELAGLVYPGEEEIKAGYIGSVEQINDIIKINRVEELIFCAKDISSQAIIRTMLKCTGTDVEFKIAPPESLSIIGSSSINTAGELYVLNFNSIGKSLNKRKKRLFDILVSLILLILSPVLIFRVNNKGRFILNIFLVFWGAASWVGYSGQAYIASLNLPGLRKGVLSPADTLKKNKADKDVIIKLNMLYAKDYKVLNDLNIIIKGIRELGRTPDGE